MESRGHDIKAAFDGKALAYGVGNSGEEDVYGFEKPPTLSERQNRLRTELEVLKSS